MKHFADGRRFSACQKKCCSRVGNRLRHPSNKKLTDVRGQHIVTHCVEPAENAGGYMLVGVIQQCIEKAQPAANSAEPVDRAWPVYVSSHIAPQLLDKSLLGQLGLPIGSPGTR